MTEDSQISKAPLPSLDQVVRRLRSISQDLRIQENLKPYAGICDEAAAELERLDVPMRLLREYMTASADPSSERLKVAWFKLEEWWMDTTRPPNSDYATSRISKS